MTVTCDNRLYSSLSIVEEQGRGTKEITVVWPVMSVVGRGRERKNADRNKRSLREGESEGQMTSGASSSSVFVVSDPDPQLRSSLVSGSLCHASGCSSWLREDKTETFWRNFSNWNEYFFEKVLLNECVLFHVFFNSRFFTRNGYWAVAVNKFGLSSLKNYDSSYILLEKMGIIHLVCIWVQL